MADIVMTNVQNVNISITGIVDAGGEPVTGATITWAADASGYFTLTPSGDGMSCNVKSAGHITAPLPGGVANIQAIAQVSGVGGGVGSMSIEVIHSPLFTVALTHDSPVNNV